MKTKVARDQVRVSPHTDTSTRAHEITAQRQLHSLLAYCWILDGDSVRAAAPCMAATISLLFQSRI
jgi:hypothetical protein